MKYSCGRFKKYSREPPGVHAEFNDPGFSGRMRGFSLTKSPAMQETMIWTPHSTVATVVENDGRFLMVEETDAGRTVFNQPAGHLDEGETLFEAAVRETLEETAWHVILTDYLGTYVYRAPNDITYVRHCFVAFPDSHEPARILDDGIIAAHWLDAATILDPGFNARSPLVIKAVQDYLAGRRMPLNSIYHLL
jgi:8-oxo-dGTP pyrophosphatase MutT (NUDIX family)